MENTITKSAMDALMLAAMTRPQPKFVLMNAESEIAFRGISQGWDRRRVKREMRKGSKSTYRR